MANQYSEEFSRLSDEELIKVVTIYRNGYNKMAILAAEDVLRARGVNYKQSSGVQLQGVSTLPKSNSEVDMMEGLLVERGVRLAHYLVDFLVVYLIVYAIIDVINMGGDTNNDKQNVMQFGVFYSVSFLYYLFMESAFNKTVAKFITKCKVVHESGNPTTFYNVLIRTLVRQIPLEALSFLLFKKGLHDRWSNTIVIKE